MTRKGPPGFILVVVLILLSALATLASIYSVYARNTALASRIPEERLESEAAIRAGIELAVLNLVSVPETAKPTHGAFAFPLGATRVGVAFASEGARVDLNAADKPLLSGLFASFGAPKEKADYYADRIIAWRTPVKPNAENPEPAAYHAAGLPYAPRQGPFDSALELTLVMGLPPELVGRVLPYVTIYSGNTQIDVVNADPRVLSALPGVTPAMLNDIVVARSRGVDPRSLLDMLGAAKEDATTDAAKCYRAEIVVDLKNRRIRADVVFALKTEGQDPYDILYWRDDFDEPMPNA